MDKRFSQVISHDHANSRNLERSASLLCVPLTSSSRAHRSHSEGEMVRIKVHILRQSLSWSISWLLRFFCHCTILVGESVENSIWMVKRERSEGNKEAVGRDGERIAQLCLESEGYQAMPWLIFAECVSHDIVRVTESQIVSSGSFTCAGFMAKWQGHDKRLRIHFSLTNPTRHLWFVCATPVLHWQL